MNEKDEMNLVGLERTENFTILTVLIESEVKTPTIEKGMIRKCFENVASNVEVQSASRLFVGC